MRFQGKNTGVGVRAGGSLSLVASTFASSFDKSTEDEKATVDKRGSVRNNCVPDKSSTRMAGKLRYERGGEGVRFLFVNPTKEFVSPFRVEQLEDFVLFRSRSFIACC